MNSLLHWLTHLIFHSWRRIHRPMARPLTQIGLGFVPRKFRRPAMAYGRSATIALLTLLAFLGTLAWGQLQTTANPYPPSEIRGVWITSNDSAMVRDHAKLNTGLSDLARLNFNTVYPVVWNSGYALFPSATAQQAGIQPFVFRGLQGQDVLADLAGLAHQKGLMVIPWFEFGFMAPPYSELTKGHPQWLTQRQDGSKRWVGAAGEVEWLNPFHPEVQQFITSLVLEVVTRYDVDGVQFDDHTSLPNEFGYDAYTTALYRKETGRLPPTNPQDPSWVKWRADKLTAFMIQLNKAIKANKPNAVVSVSPNPYDYAYKASLQDWLTWVRKGIVDELIVQVYRRDLYSFNTQLVRPEIQEARRTIPTGVGILTGLRTQPMPINLILSKVQQSRAQGLGVAFFSYESLWDKAPEPLDYRQSRLQALFNTPAPRSSSVVTQAPNTQAPNSNPLR